MTFPQENSPNANPYYPDILIFLIIIPFISAFNYYLTYSNIQLNWFLALTYSIDTVQGYLAWLSVRYLIFYLDKKYPFERNSFKRILIQVISTTLLGLLVISLTTELVSWIAKGEPAPLNFYTIDLFIISIWFLVMNGIYIGLYYYHQLQKVESHKNSNVDKGPDLIVKVGKKDIKLHYEEMAGFYVDGNYVVVCDREGKKYFLDQSQSLNKLDKVIPKALFFRLNRQFILHRQMITGFQRRKNGKLDVLIKSNPSFPSKIPVSRTKAPSFKRWFKPGQ